MRSVKTTRRRILQVASDLHLHAISDRHMQESLRRFHLRLSRNDIRRHYEYLSGRLGETRSPALALQKNEAHDMWTARILPGGVDLLTGASLAGGVRAGDPVVENLPLKKEMRRGLLIHLGEKPGDYHEDIDLLERFIEDGFTGVSLPDLQFQLWYLAGKEAVRFREIRIGAIRNYTAKITSYGADLASGDARDPGVTD